MSEIVSAIQNVLTPNEKLISVVENLRFRLYYVPHVPLLENHGPGDEAVIALTNRRIIAILWDGTVWKWLSFAALNSLVERPVNKFKSGWPYQAVLMITGGIGLLVETRTTDSEKCKKLSSLLVQGFMQFGVKRDDDAALTAIITYEEELERQRQAASDDDSKKKQ